MQDDECNDECAFGTYNTREAGTCRPRDVRVSLGVHCVAATHHQVLTIVAKDHRHIVEVCEQVPRKVERSPRQTAPALPSSVPALSPQRAHGCRRTVLQLQLG